MPDPSATSPPLPPGARRRLTELEVEFISLVSAPANGKPLVLKDAKAPRTFALKATADELMRAYGIVYAPGEVDSQGDTADAATIMRAADRWMRGDRAGAVDRQHSFTPEAAYVAESWIVRAGDPLFPEVATGAWAVGIQIGDPGLWAQLKAGYLTGLSLAGCAESEDADPSNGDGYATKGWFREFFQRLTKGDSEMNADEVKKIVFESVPNAVSEALKTLGVLDQQGHTQKSTAAPSDSTERVSKADLEGQIAALKTDLTTLLRTEIGDALTKGAGEGGSRSGLPAGDRAVFEGLL